MKLAAYVFGLLGLALMTVLVIRQGYEPVLALLSRAGFMLLWLVPLRLLPILTDVQGWRTLLKPSDPRGDARVPYLLWVASVREAVNRLLPGLSVGDLIVGMRLVIARGLNGAAVVASVIMEVLLTLCNQYLFIALGLVLLIQHRQSTPLSDKLMWGLLLSTPLPVFLGAGLRYGSLFTRIERFIEGMAGGRHRLTQLIRGSSNLDDAVRALFRQRRRLLRAAFWQFCGMVLGASEVWIALWMLGHPVTIRVAIVLESLTVGVRSLAFMIPSALGVQEAGLMLIGPLVGVAPGVALSLSLAKRMREVLFGVPALLSWQWFETRRLRKLLDSDSSILGFMSLRDIGLFVRSARSDSAIKRLRALHGARSAFETIYRETGDPWLADDDAYLYQRKKYKTILSVLPERRFTNALDVGSGLGVLSRMLAARADQVLGIDIAESAVALARQKAGHLANVRFEQGDLVQLDAGAKAQFDLVVIADALYYLDDLSDASLDRVRDRVVELLAPGGLCVLVNHYFFVADPASRLTRRIHRAFERSPQLIVERTQRKPFYLISLLTKPVRT